MQLWEAYTILDTPTGYSNEQIQEAKKLVRPTRFYSDKQEKHVAKVTGGKQVANSGATAFSKGDVRAENFLIEAKTSITEKSSFSIKKEWLDKNEEERFAMGKDYSALAFRFSPDGEDYYIISEKLFVKLINYLKEEEK